MRPHIRRASNLLQHQASHSEKPPMYWEALLQQALLHITSYDISDKDPRVRAIQEAVSPQKVLVALGIMDNSDIPRVLRGPPREG